MPSKQEIEEQLKALRAEGEAIEEKIQAIYRASLAAPAEEKVCPDWMADALVESSPNALKYPIEVLGIAPMPGVSLQKRQYPMGTWVAVRPADSKETHLGVLLGDMATQAVARFHPDTGILHVGLGGHNPAMWVPDLKRVVFGYESWWSPIRKPDDLKQITDQDIQNVWYVKAWKEVADGQEGSAGGAGSGG